MNKLTHSYLDKSTGVLVVDLLDGLIHVGLVEGGVRDDSGVKGLEENAESSDHGNTAVLELGRAVPVDGLLVLVLGETKRVKEASGSGGADEALSAHGEAANEQISRKAHIRFIKRRRRSNNCYSVK